MGNGFNPSQELSGNSGPTGFPGDPGHETTRPWSVKSLQGGMAETFELPPIMPKNTGPVRGDIANAMWSDSPTSGFMSGDTWSYQGHPTA